MEEFFEMFEKETPEKARKRKESSGSSPTAAGNSVGPQPEHDEVSVLIAKFDPIEIDWSDTMGSHYLGDWFIAYHRSFSIFLFVLIIAFSGAGLTFLAFIQIIPPAFTFLGLLLAIPHVIFDVLLWQRELAKQLVVSSAVVPLMLNNFLFLIMIIILALSPDNAPIFMPLVGLGVAVPTVNCCVHFYDAFHPEIAVKGLALSLTTLLIFGVMIMVSIYAEMVSIDDVSLPMGGFNMNAKSLLFVAIQNMVVMWLLQLVKRFRSLPGTMKALSSTMEIKLVRTEVLGMMSATHKNSLTVDKAHEARLQAIAAKHKGIATMQAV